MKTFDFTDTGGLFDHFEVNREPFWPRIVWLVAGSGAWHLVVIVLVILIPPVRDAFSITALFRGADFVDRPYKHSEIGDDVDIIDFTTEKFHYPEGYFLMDQQGMPPVQFPTPLPFNPQPATVTPAATPTPTPAPTPNASPSPLIAANTGDAKKPSATPSPTSSPDDKSVEQAQKDLDAAAKKAGIDLPEEGQVNKAPFKDLATYANSLKKEGKLDFNKSFEVVIDSTLDDKGKLVNAKVTKKSGDETLIDLGKHFIASLNDSGVLRYLQVVSKDKPNANIVFTIKQNGNDVAATVDVETSSPDNAQKFKGTFSDLMWFGRLSRKGKDEEILLKKTKVSADGNRVVFNLTMQHQEVVEIVNRGMAEPSPSVTP